MSEHTDYMSGPMAQPTQFNPDHQGAHPPIAVQVLSILGFGVFSVVGVSLAFGAHWVAGVAVSIVIASTWAGSRTFGGKGKPKHGHKVANLVPNVAQRHSTGNASFDAYRAEMMTRLEQESRDFETFLARLRHARDAAEFDQFMDDRAKAAYAETTPTPA